VPQNDGPLSCPRCGETDHFGDMRFWSAVEPYRERLPDGKVVSYPFLCDDCHRELVRN
jgi:hypothetical protein